MRSSTQILLLVALGCATLASGQFYNNVPVPGRRPEYQNGTASQGIDFDIVYDLMCSDSAALHPEFEKFLATTWNETGKTVAESVKVTYSFLPLPYHHETWIPHRLIPFFLDNCQFPGTHPCQFMDYMNYCFENQDTILGAKNISENAIILSWTNMVANALSLTQAELLTVFNNAYDTHNSEMRAREMYKYNAHHHVSGTPFGFVNGVLLENFPEKAADWMTVLTSVYGSQYKPSKAAAKREDM